MVQSWVFPVSRVGGALRVKAMKKVAGGLRLNLASFRDLEAFAQLGTDLDAATQSKLDRGYRMVELLKQGQYAPLNVVDQVLMIFAGTRGYLDDVPVTRVAEWERDFLTFMHDQKPDIRKTIIDTLDLDEATTAKLVSAIGEFKMQFAQKKKDEPAKQLAATK